MDVVLDAVDDAYVVGRTQSEQFPTINPYQGTRSGNYDAFLAKITSAGSVIYSTYIGGDFNDQGIGIDLDTTGDVYIAGATSSTIFPTLYAYQQTNAGDFDGFVAKFTYSAPVLSLVYSTYFGGRGREYCWLPAHVLDVDDGGDLYIAMDTTSDDLPTTSKAHCREFDRGQLAAVARLSPRPCSTVDYPNVTIEEGNNQLNITWNISSRAIPMSAVRNTGTSLRPSATTKMTAKNLKSCPSRLIAANYSTRELARQEKKSRLCKCAFLAP